MHDSECHLRRHLSLATWTARQPSIGSFESTQSDTYSFHHLQGQRVRITLANGSEFEGTYANAQDPNTCRLTTVTQKKLPNSADMNGASRKEQGTMTFQKKEIVDARPLLVNNIGKSDGKPTNGTMDKQLALSRLFVCY